jgi:hypothetical protein
VGFVTIARDKSFLTQYVTLKKIMILSVLIVKIGLLLISVIALVLGLNGMANSNSIKDVNPSVVYPSAMFFVLSLLIFINYLISGF